MEQLSHPMDAIYYGDLIDMFDGDKKHRVIRKINQRRDNWARDEETRKGNKRIKDEIDRIKATTPKKVLDVMMTLQTTLMELEDDIPQEAFEKLNDIIATPENDTNLFSCMTELMSVCQYTETSLAPERRFTHHKQCEVLTEAQKLARALDPNDKTYVICPGCNRTMTTGWFSKHKHTHTCKRACESKKVALKNKAMYQPDYAKEIIDMNLMTPDELAEYMKEIDMGTYQEGRRG
jgi:adenosyl cobinamide kinase/adenosyl cobinamide phosphate guanylyltransferase